MPTDLSNNDVLARCKVHHPTIFTYIVYGEVDGWFPFFRFVLTHLIGVLATVVLFYSCLISPHFGFFHL